MALRELYHFVRNFLFSRANREFLSFLFFFVMAGFFWLLMTLNDNYEQEIRIPVRYVNVPKNAVLTSGETDTLRVNVSDKGLVLAAYLYGHDMLPIAIDFKSYAHAGGNGTVPAADLKKMVAQRIAASSKIVSVKPDRLNFYYNYGEKKRVAVAYSGQVTPGDMYYLARVDYRPDSVTIFASAERLDSIGLVLTEPVDIADGRDTVTVTARIRSMQGVKVVPERVDVRFFFDVLSEVTFDDIPIRGINMPEGKKLRTFPAKVRVKCVTGVNIYRNVSAADFEVVADYREIQAAPSSQCRIYLRRTPEGIKRPKLETTHVDYLIEE